MSDNTTIVQKTYFKKCFCDILCFFNIALIWNAVIFLYVILIIHSLWFENRHCGLNPLQTNPKTRITVVCFCQPIKVHLTTVPVQSQIVHKHFKGIGYIMVQRVKLILRECIFIFLSLNVAAKGQKIAENGYF